MRVMILADDERLGLKKGEVYSAQRYRYDPTEKISLLAREPDGYDPSCNQYMEEVAHWMKDAWYEIKNRQYVKMEPQP